MKTLKKSVKFKFQRSPNKSPHLYDESNCYKPYEGGGGRKRGKQRKNIPAGIYFNGISIQILTKRLVAPRKPVAFMY